MILEPLCLFAMDCALHGSLYDLVDDKYIMPRVCENASMSDIPHDCDAMLHESLGVVDIPNIKLLRKRLRSFIRI